MGSNDTERPLADEAEVPVILLRRSGLSAHLRATRGPRAAGDVRRDDAEEAQCGRNELLLLEPKKELL